MHAHLSTNATKLCIRWFHKRRVVLPKYRHHRPYSAHTFLFRIGNNILTRFSAIRQLSTVPHLHTPTRSRTLEERFQVAVVGSGPAGFYTTHRILSALPGSHIDIYEALPVPFGLVRYGVAPDHPEVKTCEERFSQIAQSSRVRYLGNVAVGQAALDQTQASIPLSTLRRHYDAIVLAYGASEDKLLHIPGETDLSGIYSARQFVGWYNGHPDQAGLAPDLSGNDAVIVGHGNVALDVARILLTQVDDLGKTDISEEALAHLSSSRIKRVRVVGRRGPMQASFTIKEIRELLKLPQASFEPMDTALIPRDTSNLPRPAKRLMDILLKGVDGSPSTMPSRSWSLDFCLSPQQFLGASSLSDSHRSHVASSVFEKVQLVSPFEPTSRTRPLGEIVRIPSRTVFRSTGYRFVPINGLLELGARLDDNTGAILNDGFGRVASPVHRHVTHSVSTQGNSQIDGHNETPVLAPAPGMYCSGWVKRGPTGVIASTMQDAFETADTVCRDWLAGVPFLAPVGSTNIFCGPAIDSPVNTAEDEKRHGWDGVKADQTTCNLDSARVVTWSDWQRLNEIEMSRGRERGKPREKFTSRMKMLHELA